MGWSCTTDRNLSETEQYGNSAVLKWSVYKWIDKLKNSGTSITDRNLPGRTWTAATDENIRYFCPKILNKRRLAVFEVTDHLHISRGSTREIICNRLSLHKVCARWVPSNSQESSSANVRASTTAFCINWQLLETHYHEGWNSIAFQRANSRAQTSASQKKVWSSTYSEKSDVHYFLGFTGASNGISREWYIRK